MNDSKLSIRIPKIDLRPFPTPKYIFLFIYFILCAIVVIPQIDYQRWYPGFLGVHDFKTGADFDDHKMIKFEMEEESSEPYTTIYKRAKSAGINDLVIKKEENEFMIHTSSELSDEALAQIFSTGKINILSYETSQDLQIDPSMIQQPQAKEYSDTGIDPSKISKTRIKEVTEYGGQIEIYADDETVERINEEANDFENGTVMTIDGREYETYLIPADGEQFKRPMMMFSSTEEEISMINAHLNSGELDINPETLEIHSAQQLHSDLSGYAVIGILGAVMIIGFGYNYFLKKENRDQAAYGIILTTGIIALLKVLLPGLGITLTFSLSTIILGILILGILNLLPKSKHLIISGLMIVLGAALAQTINPNMMHSAVLTFSIGVISFLTYTITYLIGIHD